MAANKYAGFLERFIARVLDFNIITLSLASLFFLFTGNFSLEWRSGWTWEVFYLVYLIMVPVLWSGYVIGKRICKIKLQRTNDEHVNFTNTFMREVVGFHVIGILTLGISLIVSVFMIIFREDKRAIHDIVGGTYVRRAYW
ncbi:RDD family protein [Virgibacillus xinjiangensis]|uniref:RDD family protein n=1 Tax=Virgibacillus xinjiangensis TaxID=393090 RepID=A0ABV7CSU2_9BACI